MNRRQAPRAPGSMTAARISPTPRRRGPSRRSPRNALQIVPTTASPWLVSNVESTTARPIAVAATMPPATAIPNAARRRPRRRVGARTAAGGQQDHGGEQRPRAQRGEAPAPRGRLDQRGLQAASAEAHELRVPRGEHLPRRRRTRRDGVVQFAPGTGKPVAPLAPSPANSPRCSASSLRPRGSGLRTLGSGRPRPRRPRARAVAAPAPARPRSRGSRPARRSRRRPRPVRSAPVARAANACGRARRGGVEGEAAGISAITPVISSTAHGHPGFRAIRGP